MVVAVQVLRYVPPEHQNDVFAGGVADIITAIKLPASLLSKWIAFSTGDIDLRSAQLSLEQWVKLAAAICQAPPGTVQALHVNMAYSGDGLKVAMSALQSIVGHTTHLQSLGLHMIWPRAENLPLLYQLFSECPGSLEELLLDMKYNVYGIRSLDVQQKTRMFAAVAQMHGLRELHIPQWRAYTSGDCEGDYAHIEVCDPLRRIPALKICVPKSELGTASLKRCSTYGLDFIGFE